MDWSGCRHTACNEAGNSVPVATYRLQLSRVLPRSVVAAGFIAVAAACLLGVGLLLLRPA